MTKFNFWRDFGAWSSYSPELNLSIIKINIIKLTHKKKIILHFNNKIIHLKYFLLINSLL